MRKFKFGLFQESFRAGWTFRAGRMAANNQYIPLKITREECLDWCLSQELPIAPMAVYDWLIDQMRKGAGNEST